MKYSRVCPASTLNASPQVPLFRAVLRWGEAQLKQQNKEKSPETMRCVRSASTHELIRSANACRCSAVLAKMIPLIRFPTMTMQDMISDVMPSGLLTEEQVCNSARPKFCCFTYVCAWA